MTRREYKPYPTRKEQKNRMMRTIALVLIVLIAAVVIFTRTYNRQQPQPTENGTEQKIPRESILPGKPAEAAAQSEPLRVPNPAVNTPPPQLTPSPAAPATTPEVKPEPVIRTIQAPQETLTAPDAETEQTSDKAKEVIKQATELRDGGKIIPARDLLNDTLNMPLSPSIRTAVKLELSNLAQKWLFEPTVFTDDKLTAYVLVQSGDLLQDIAKTYKVPYEILMEINKISRPELLQAGKKIKVIQGPFNVVIYKKSYTMDLYLQNKYVKTYRVGLGTAEHETPAGRWRVAKDGKLVKPTWTDPDTGKRYLGTDPDYPLGSRWIAIEGMDENTRQRTGFAIHGTKDPESIGTRSSRGCIRLFNGDVIEVYNLLYPGLSEVLVED